MPFLIRQVETHLVFGPLSRHLPLGYLVLLYLAGHIAMTIFSAVTSDASFNVIGTARLIEGLFFLSLTVYVIRTMTCRQQAVMGLVAFKFGIGVLAFFLALIWPTVSLAEGRPWEACSLFLLGILWFPLIEFHPRVTPHQKYLTLGRISLSIPLLFWISHTEFLT